MRAAIVALLLLTGCHRSEPQSIMVFAAASLTDALNEVGNAFQEINPEFKVIVSVGPTSLLARQIQFGAPADVFMAADPVWTTMLQDNGHLEGTAHMILANRLVVAGSSATPQLASLEELIGAGRIAIADPTHVPAGVYARTSLMCAGLWEKLTPQVIPTLDVRAAAVAVTSGAADLAIIYATDVGLEPKLKVLMDWPQVCAPDIVYAASVVSRTPDTSAARAFVEFAASAASDAIWEQFGFIRDLE